MQTIQADAATAADRIVALILAGGAGRRFGSDKAAVAIDGRTSLERVVAAARPSVGAIYVIGGSGPLPPGVTARVDDRFPGAGPLQAILSGWAVAADAGAETDAIVIACDQPLIQPAAIALLAAPLAAQFDGRIPRLEGHAQPLIGRYRARARVRLDQAWAQGGRSMRGAIAALRIEWLEADALRAAGIEPERLADFDTGDDLRRLMEMAPDGDG